MAFITFRDHENAVLALQAFQGLRFDIENAATDLRVELAKTTSFIPNQTNAPILTIGGKKRGSDDDAPYSSFHPYYQPPPPADDYANDKRQRSSASGGKHGTLYVVNIGPNVTEEELRETFGAQPGFRALKVKPIRSGTCIVAWCDYYTHEQAQAAMEALQGHRLPAGLGPALKIEFANCAMNLAAIKEGAAPSQHSHQSVGQLAAQAAAASANRPADPYAAAAAAVSGAYGQYYYPPAGYPPLFPPVHSYNHPY